MIARLVDDRLAVDPFPNDPASRARVVAAGPDAAASYPEGSLVICDWQAGVPLQVNGVQLRVITTENVLAAVEEDDVDAAAAEAARGGRLAASRIPVRWGAPDA